MKVALVVLSLLATGGCAASSQLLSRRPPAPDQGVVEQLVCSGQEERADYYLEVCGAGRAERIERVERARARCAPTAGGAE